MKANEIQIGDWIEWMGNKCKVDLPLLMTEYQDNIDGNNVKPIPLTSEILEKNGFRDYFGYGYANNKGCYCEGFYMNNDFTIRVSNVSRKLNYVHELQHVLRLCVLNDLADNFKI